MNAQETVETINAVTAALAGPSAATIDAYTHYMVWASLAYVGLGCALMGAAAFVALSEKFENMDGLNWMLAIFLGLAGLAVVLCNLGDLVSPHAAAIHQFIRDLRAA